MQMSEGLVGHPAGLGMLSKRQRETISLGFRVSRSFHDAEWLVPFNPAKDQQAWGQQGGGKTCVNLVD